VTLLAERTGTAGNRARGHAKPGIGRPEPGRRPVRTNVEPGIAAFGDRSYAGLPNVLRPLLDREDRYLRRTCGDLRSPADPNRPRIREVSGQFR
jgi:hypothetical protein